MAESVGFEPTSLLHVNGFQDRRLTTRPTFQWRWRRDSNSHPGTYKVPALPIKSYTSNIFGADREIRTRTNSGLNRTPLPVALDRHFIMAEDIGFEPMRVLSRLQCSKLIHYRSVNLPMVRIEGVEPPKFGS